MSIPGWRGSATGSMPFPCSPIGSGWRIFRAFPASALKIPERVLINIPDAFTLGRGLSGALQWHLTFMFPFVLTGPFYVCYELASGHYRQVLFTVKDVPGLWPMFRHYFLFGPKPKAPNRTMRQVKQAYTAAVMFGASVSDHGCDAMETSAVMVAGVADGRVPLGARLALPRHVRIAAYLATSDGGAPWLQQFLVYDHRMEERPEYLADAVSAEAGSEPSD